MRLVIREFQLGKERPTEVLVLSLRESDVFEGELSQWVETEEVDEADEHWANDFNTRTYTVAEVRQLIVDDQKRRRQRKLQRQAEEGIQQ